MKANIVRDEDPAGEAARVPLCTRAEPEGVEALRSIKCMPIIPTW